MNADIGLIFLCLVFVIFLFIGIIKVGEFLNNFILKFGNEYRFRKIIRRLFR